MCLTVELTLHAWERLPAVVHHFRTADTPANDYPTSISQNIVYLQVVLFEFGVRNLQHDVHAGYIAVCPPVCSSSLCLVLPQWPL